MEEIICFLGVSITFNRRFLKPTRQFAVEINLFRLKLNAPYHAVVVLVVANQQWAILRVEQVRHTLCLVILGLKIYFN